MTYVVGTGKVHPATAGNAMRSEHDHRTERVLKKSATAVTRAPQPPPNDNPSLQNTVRLDFAKLTAILNALDAHDETNTSSSTAPKRTYVRWPFRQRCLNVSFTHAAGTNANVIVACRNLSCGGMSLLHNSYVHVGTGCDVVLPRVTDGVCAVPGTVVRCRHLHGVIHEVGVRFKQPIRASDFVALDPLLGTFSLEKVNPHELRGTLLYIADSTLDERLIRHYLRETEMRLQTTASGEEAIAKAKSGVDLIICESTLGKLHGVDVCAAIRETGVVTPIIMITGDTSVSGRELSLRAQADAYLPKPITQNVLFRAIAEFVVMDDGRGSTISSLAASHPSYPLVDSFRAEMADHTARLERALEAGDIEGTRALCLQIAGIAPVVGFEKLALVADSAATAIAQTGGLTEAQQAVRRLITVCNRVRGRSAA